MIVLDASIMVSALWPQDTHHVTSQNWLQHHFHSATPMLAPGLFLSEVAGAITRRTNDQSLGYEAANYIQMLPTLDLLDLDSTLVLRSTDIAIALRLRGADAIYVALAEQHGLPLFTWDREQYERGSQRITTRRPDET